MISLVSEGSYHEKRLLKDLLLSGYRKDMRPVKNDSDKVVVRMGLSLSQIIDVVSIHKGCIIKKVVGA